MSNQPAQLKGNPTLSETQQSVQSQENNAGAQHVSSFQHSPEGIYMNYQQVPMSATASSGANQQTNGQSTMPLPPIQGYPIQPTMSNAMLQRYPLQHGLQNAPYFQPLAYNPNTTTGANPTSGPIVPPMQNYHQYNYPSAVTNIENVSTNQGQHVPTQVQTQIYPQLTTPYGHMPYGQYPYQTVPIYAAHVPGFGHQTVQAHGAPFGYIQQQPHQFPVPLMYGYPPPVHATSQQNIILPSQNSIPLSGRDQFETDLYGQKDSISSYSDSDGESVTDNTSLYVKGLNNASKDQLKIFFEDEDGVAGHVRSVTCNSREAKVTFHSSADVQKVLRMAAKNGGKLSAKSLGRIKVLAYDPRRHHIECEATDIDKVVEDSGEDSPEENDKQSGNKLTVLLIQRVPPKTTDEALRLYFEAKHKLEPTTIYRGDAEDAVLMDFQTRIDIRRIEDDCKRFKCCGNELKIDVVPACIWIKVWGYGTDTSIDLLENYFENKRRSDGGTVDNVRFLENEDAAVVTFKFESDARAVCAKSHHTLKEKRLHTVLYHERLFPTRQRVIVIPEPIEKVVDNKTIVQLFSKSDYFEESWKGESKEIFGKLTFVTEQSLLKITLHCNVSPKETDASLKVQTWLSNGKTFLDNKLATIDVESIDIGEKVFKQVREKIGEINVAEPHKLALKINNTNSSVDIVGERKAVADLRRQIKAMVEEQQYTFERDNRQITEHVALREHEVTLLRHRAVRQSLDGSDVDVKIEAEEIKFTGKRPDVQLALNKLDDAKRNMRQVQLTEFQDIVKELLEKEAVRSFVDKEIESTGVTALWKTTSNGVVMFTYSFKNEDIDRVIVRFRSLLRFITVPLSKDEHDGLLSTEGQSFKKSLNDQFDIVISVSDTSLQYACLKKNADEVRTEIEKFLHNFRNQIQFVETHPTKCKVLKKYCATKLNGIAKKNNVKIEQTSQGRRSGFAISGTAECVDKANESMVRLVRNVKQLRLEYKWPGFQKFAMQSSEGHKAIENIEQEEKCIIIVEGQNFQNERKSTEKIAVQLAGGIKLNVLMRGSIFQKQADVIVNSTNRDLDMSKGTMSKQLLKEAGQGIQIECQQKYPRGIRHGEIAVTSPGRLTSYKQIFHVALPRCHGAQDVKGLRKYVRTCMHEADKNGAQTICFPALGTGSLEYPADGVAKTMELTIQNFGQDNPRSSIRKVFIYIHESDEKTKQSFKDHFGSPVAAATSTSDRRSSDGTNAAQLTVYFHKEQSEQSIKNKIERLRRIDEIFLSASLIEKLTEEKMKEVYKIATPNDVKVKCEDNKMKLFGYGKSVVKTKAALQDYLKKLDDGQSASAAVQFPPTWGKMTINDAPKNVPLVAGSTDYTTVASTFQGQYAAANIVQIDRVQNPQLYMQYLAKKKQIEKTCSRPNCEQKLWHGTRTPQIADNICAKGFDRNYNSGASIGVGVYFAVNATMSATGYTAPDALGQRYIFYADVLTGDYTVGSGSIRVPPAKVPGNNLVTFDSTTDNVAAPSMFVIFHDAQAYPTYKITFK